ncbi:glutamate--tRNA ligase [Liberiplasma polymorphum]|uniref:glutamate--tRNA ligase n=1 Tax=Liberiplasma polymorphum TaxID=3374570 RepID=UPI0037709474
MKVRVRYAPSPTGHLHIGNARTALFNYLFAKKYEGDFIVRIEDTDIARNVETGVDSQMAYLKWLGIDWDESIDKDGGYGPYSQLERLDLYRKYTDILLENGLAYKCYCTSEELTEEREAQIARGDDQFHYSRKCLGLPEQDKPFTIRFKVPENKQYTFNDMVKGEVTFSSDDVGDWVMMKQNGIPTYNFACVVDDYLMEISHVLRGEDHITNTPKQLMVFDAFNWRYPTYGHMTLIVNENNKKLSKRDESILQFIEQYKALGYLPEALFNFITLLGWSPKEEGEIFTKSEFITMFDESRLSKSPAKFDKDKLAYINNRYIKQLSLEDTISLCRPFLDSAQIGIDQEDSWFESLIGVFKDRLSYGQEIVKLYHDFFDQAFTLDSEEKSFMKQEGVVNLIEIFKTKIIETSTLNPESLKELIKESGKLTNMKGKMLFMPIRIAVSGAMHGPELPQMMHLMGKNRLLENLDKTLDLIK